MIFLLYGPDVASCRAFLLNFKKNYSDIVVISGKKQTAASLHLPEEENLFGGKKLFIIEDFAPKQKEPLEELGNIDIVITSQELTTPPSWVSKSWLFKQAETLSNFKLADQIALGQEKQALLTLSRLLKQRTPSELIIGSLVRQFRLISLVLSGETEAVSKSPFVISKTSQQAKSWNFSKVKKALILILKADFEIKTGLLDQEVALTIVVSKIASLALD